MSYKALQQPILFFDGVCNLCSGAVQFIMQRDTKKQFVFASLQSPPGIEAIADTYINDAEAGSIILYYRGKYYLRSAAILKTAQLLGGIWRLAGIFQLLPTTFRDTLYKWVARNRYRWFGKSKDCYLPTPENKARFLD